MINVHFSIFNWHFLKFYSILYRDIAQGHLTPNAFTQIYNLQQTTLLILLYSSGRVVFSELCHLDSKPKPTSENVLYPIPDHPVWKLWNVFCKTLHAAFPVFIKAKKVYIFRGQWFLFLDNVRLIQKLCENSKNLTKK